jgi:hypothetical protein
VIAKRIVGVLTGVMVALAPIAMTPSVASAGEPQPLAYEENFATDVDWHDAGQECFDPPASQGVNGCVQPYGDVLWVLDRWADGHAVSLTWSERTYPFREPTGRYGKCIDKLGEAVGWTVCDKDFTEGNIIQWTLDYWDADQGKWEQVGIAETFV